MWILFRHPAHHLLYPWWSRERSALSEVEFRDSSLLRYILVNMDALRSVPDYIGSQVTTRKNIGLISWKGFRKSRYRTPKEDCGKLKQTLSTLHPLYCSLCSKGWLSIKINNKRSCTTNPGMCVVRTSWNIGWDSQAKTKSWGCSERGPKCEKTLKPWP
jgi:hypothetical protein